MQEIIIKKTQDLTEEERKQLTDGFVECFPTHVMTEDQLFAKYYANHFGFSYHAICIEDGKIIGSLSASPYWYEYQSERIKIALTCDVYIIPAFRSDIRIFANLNKNLKEYCGNEGIVCFLGVANENAYTYTIRLLRCKELFSLSYWILPIRIGNVAKKSWLKPFNILSLCYTYLSVGVNTLVSSIVNSRERPSICKIISDDSFLTNRLPESRYTNIKKNDVFFSYVITNDEDIRCAYIMMVSENGRRSYKALCKCVSHIVSYEKVDMVMFIGTLNLNQGLLIKTPQKFEPRTLHLTINYLTKDFEKQYPNIMQPNGIDFTLLNLDVR